MGFIARHRSRPVIDRVVELDDALAAHEHVAAGQHLGKVMIKL
jgi:NADPH:quinone reductase-like Zn-dependent oxidoreductase